MLGKERDTYPLQLCCRHYNPDNNKYMALHTAVAPCGTHTKCLRPRYVVVFEFKQQNPGQTLTKLDHTGRKLAILAFTWANPQQHWGSLA
jgi:hypothetical protein